MRVLDGGDCFMLERGTLRLEVPKSCRWLLYRAGDKTNSCTKMLPPIRHKNRDRSGIDIKCMVMGGGLRRYGLASILSIQLRTSVLCPCCPFVRGVFPLPVVGVSFLARTGFCFSSVCRHIKRQILILTSAWVSWRVTNLFHHVGRTKANLHQQRQRQEGHLCHLPCHRDPPDIGSDGFAVPS